MSTNYSSVRLTQPNHQPLPPTPIHMHTHTHTHMFSILTNHRLYTCRNSECHHPGSLYLLFLPEAFFNWPYPVFEFMTFSMCEEEKDILKDNGAIGAM